MVFWRTIPQLVILIIMYKMKNISCIIPVYGLTIGENTKYFNDLIHSLSIALEKLKGRFEIIIVNDDVARIPKESIMCVLASYGLLGHVIYVENETNRGQAYSRNVGVAHSSYDFFHFIDQDDFVSDNFYEEFNMSDVDTDIFISKPFFFKNNKIFPAYTKWLNIVYKNASKMNDLWYLLLSNVVYSPGQVIMSKSSYYKAGSFPVLHNRGADDFALFYRMVFSSTCFSVRYMAYSSFYYRIHSQQNSKQSSTNESVLEYFKGYQADSLKEKIIISIKSKGILSFVGKMFYLLFFRCA